MTTDGDSNEKDDKSTPRQRQRMALIGLITLIVCFVIALTVGMVLNDEDDDDDITLVDREGFIVDCLPELRRNETKMRTSKEECTRRGCLFKPQLEKGAPWCHMANTKVYTLAHEQTNEAQGNYTNMTAELVTDRQSSPGVVNVFENVTVHVEFQTDHRVRIKIHPTNMTGRWQIPSHILNIEDTNDEKTNNATSKLSVAFVENPFGVIVTRKDTGTVVFNSSHPGTLLADQFLQLTTSLASGHLYGFGEHRHRSLHHDLSWKSWAMFTRDAGPNSDWNLYGQHPVYLNVEDDGKANMVLLKNSNAMEVLLQPEPFPAVTFTTIGGVLDFYVYVGDSPSDVTSHYIKSIGRPAFPPYWSLGYHLSRWGYQNITDMRNVMERTIDAKIPYDGQWADIDTYYKKYPFTYDPDLWGGLPKFVRDLKKGNRHFVTIVNPGVGANKSIVQEIKQIKDFSNYDMLNSGKLESVFVLNSTGTGELVGKVWPGITVFPDFTKPNTQNWWTEQISHYINTLCIKADALWIDMNECASFVPGSVNGCQNNTWNYPPWCPNILGAGEDCRMFDKTLCMDSIQDLGRHYDVHSLYGHSMAMQTYKALERVHTDKRPWTMTRSSFVGTGHYATKWTGDNRATWEDMHYSIISILEFGFLDFPWVQGHGTSDSSFQEMLSRRIAFSRFTSTNGADICGFWLEPSFELCVRWHQLGAFYPFARNHNALGDAPNFFKHQDPASFGQEFVDLVKPVLYTRYKFLPYLYTNLYRAHEEGQMMMQPLFYQFPKDAKALKIDTQFMLGPAMLISPVLKEGATSVSAYFPKGRWFDYLTGEEINSEGSTFDLSTPLDKFNLHVRGGYVIPWQKPKVTTYASRLNEFGLFVALDETGRAKGEMFWDDGESKLSKTNNGIIKFYMEQAGNLTIKGETIRGLKLLKTIEICGLPRLPLTITTSRSKQATAKYINGGIIRVTGLNLSMTKATWIAWSLY